MISNVPHFPWALDLVGTVSTLLNRTSSLRASRFSKPLVLRNGNATLRFLPIGGLQCRFGPSFVSRRDEPLDLKAYSFLHQIFSFRFTICSFRAASSFPTKVVKNGLLMPYLPVMSTLLSKQVALSLRCPRSDALCSFCPLRFWRGLSFDFSSQRSNLCSVHPNP